MKTERELFEAWAKKETNWDLYWSENIKQYMDHQTNGAWLAWQARVPEGYVVVPKEPSEEVITRVGDCIFDNADTTKQHVRNCAIKTYKTAIGE